MGGFFIKNPGFFQPCQNCLGISYLVEYVDRIFVGNEEVSAWNFSITLKNSLFGNTEVLEWNLLISLDPEKIFNWKLQYFHLK